MEIREFLFSGQVPGSELVTKSDYFFFIGGFGLREFFCDLFIFFDLWSILTRDK